MSATLPQCGLCPDESLPRTVATDVVMLRDMGGDNRDSSMPRTLYMVVEHFKNKDAVAVYRRFRDSGRLAPEGLLYVSSWIDDKLERCYQLMETHDRSLLDQWLANWSDIVDFEVYPVITSKEAVERVNPRLLSRNALFSNPLKEIVQYQRFEGLPPC